jgi:Oxyanion-translocating ATPase
MRNLIVAIQGGSGVGKTTFSAALATVLAETINGVLLVSPDVYNPAYATLFPRDKGMHLESLGRLADNPYFDAQFVKSILTPLPKNEAIGILGYLKDNNTEKYNRIEENMAIRFLDVTRGFAEITLVDCANPYLDAISHMALLKADIVFTLLEPDEKRHRVL